MALRGNPRQDAEMGGSENTNLCSEYGDFILCFSVSKHFVLVRFLPQWSAAPFAESVEAWDVLATDIWMLQTSGLWRFTGKQFFVEEIIVGLGTRGLC